MTEQLLEQRLDSVLSFIEATAKQTTAFAQAQAPDVIREILAWNFWTSLILFTIGVVMGLVGIALTAWGWKWSLKAKFHDADDVANAFFVTVVFWLVLGFFIAACISKDLDWLQILIAPKLYLIEYAATFLPH